MTSQQEQQLIRLYKTRQDHCERHRAHALLSGHCHYTIPDLADLFEVDPDTVSRLMDRWQEWLVNSQAPPTLQDQVRAGRPSSLAVDQKKA